MITCSNIRAQGADYLTRHLSSNDYYLEGESIVGTWFGKGCESLGLVPGSEVSKEDFASIGNNRKPDGSKLTALDMPDRKSWTDVQISAPKDVSILAVVGGDERLKVAFDQAADVAMLAMQDYAGTRERRGHLHESEETRRTGNVIAAKYSHDTSRALDPQMHKHFVTANATLDQESGRHMALQSRDMMLASRYARRVMYDHLAASCERLGYRVTNEGESGFNIEGVSDTMREKFSQRETQIDTAAKAFEVEHGREPSAKERAVLTRESRDAKLREISTAEVREYQRSRLSPTESKDLAGLVASAAATPEKAPSTPPPSPADLDTRLNGALSHCTERQSVVREWDALETVYAHKAAGTRLDADAVAGRLKERTAGPVADLHSGNGSRLTTATVAREEADTVRAALVGKGSCKPLASLERLEAAQAAAEAVPGAVRLSDDQLTAARLLAGNQDRVSVLVGDAGTGKTFALQRLRDASDSSWIALGPTTRARDELKANGFADSETVAAFLKNPKTQAAAKGSTILVDEAGLLDMPQMRKLLGVAREQDCRVLLVGDPKQHHSVGRGDALRAVLDGARHAAPAGDDQSSGLAVARLQTVRRQTSEAHREVSDLLARGQVGEALDKQVGELRTVEEVKNERKLFASAADHYMARREALAQERGGAAGKSPDVLGVCRTWEDIGRFSGEIRARMREGGQLGEERTANIVQPSGWTDEENTVAGKYQPGKHVVTFQQKAETIGAKAGENWSVEAVEKDGLVLRRLDEAAPRKGQQKQPVSRPRKIGWKDLRGAEVGERREIPLAPGDSIQFRANCRNGKKAVANNGDVRVVKSIGKDGRLNLVGGGQVPASFRNFCHGYAVTSHKSQGASVKETVIVMGAAACGSADVRSNYVNMTRHKENSRVFVADLAGMRSSLLRSVARGPGRELVAEMPTASAPRRMPATPKAPLAARMPPSAAPPMPVQNVPIAKKPVPVASAKSAPGALVKPAPAPSFFGRVSVPVPKPATKPVAVAQPVLVAKPAPKAKPTLATKPTPASSVFGPVSAAAKRVAKLAQQTILGAAKAVTGKIPKAAEKAPEKAPAPAPAKAALVKSPTPPRSTSKGRGLSFGL